MSSVLGRDDLRATLYSSGIKNPRDMSVVMRMIDVYALQVARKANGLEELPIAPAFTPLKPGEYSVALEVTCCAGCTRVRRWEDYHVDKNHPTGHKLLCRDCRKPDNPATRGIRRGGWLCPECKTRKIPEDFPMEKKLNSRKSIKCLSCMS